ncbi:dephospho-CoA kinase [Flagellimonas beolgyonensis]|uniref:dephospho-CoA kinase n=1 Tax=Flagellimonas beolgyonensis TaxID=864064 RepID=UPI000F8E822E|nr:dephospho-CoA kinase [Allomuricauda beolgyonensis]
MMLVGLTGGIGSGKSTVAQIFRDLGVPVYDSDKEAKSLMVNSPELKSAIIDLLGDNAYTGKTLNRSYIAELVFKDVRLLQKLNKIVHPAVRQHFLKWANEQSAPYVIQETALIFENGVQDNYSATILVTAPLEMRLKRVMERDGVGKQVVLERMKNQMDDNQKIDLAQFCIENIDLEATKEKVRGLHAKLRSMAAKF